MLISLRYLRIRRVTLLILASAAFLIGLAMVKLGVVLTSIFWLVLVAALLPFCFKRKWPALAACILIGLLLGLYRGGQAELELQKYQPLIDQKVAMRGVVNVDPTYGDKGQQEFRIDRVEFIKSDGSAEKLPGQVRATSFAIEDIKRGDRLELSGKLRNGFGNYQAAMYFAELENYTPQQNFIDQARYLFAAGVYNAIPEPQASLGLGFLVGLRSQLPEDLDDQLQLVGLTHIVVASGYNLTILVRLGRRLLARSSKYQATLASALLIVGFVFVTGFSPSMTRAALVTGLALAAWYYGRRIHPVLLILLAAAITAAFNPLYLWSDIGWYLSFLAFAGVMLLAPLIQARFIKKEKPNFIVQVAVETICAQGLTLPIILFIFGDFSTLALIANLLIVPLIPIAMLLSFVAGLVGMIAPVIAGWVALPATWLLTYMTEIVNLLASIPWAQIKVQINTPTMISFYSLIFIFGAIIYQKTKFNFNHSRSVIE